MKMDFAIPAAISQDLGRLRDFIRTQLVPDLPSWAQKQKIPDRFFHRMGEGGWYGFKIKGGHHLGCRYFWGRIRHF
jgi:hypothetical protein